MKRKLLDSVKFKELDFQRSNPQAIKDFKEAIETGNIEKVKILMDEFGANDYKNIVIEDLSNNSTRLKFTPIQYAIKKNQAEIVNYFLNNTANPISELEKVELLSYTIQENYEVWSLELINNIGVKLVKGNNLLKLCLEKNSTVLNALLSKLSVQDKNDELISAVTKGNARLTETLLNNGANPNIQMNNNSTILEHSLAKNDLNIFSILLSKLSVQDKNDELIKAVTKGNVELTETLLNNGAENYIKTNKGKNLSSLNDSPAIQKLLKAGAKLPMDDENYDLSNQIYLPDFKRELAKNPDRINITLSNGKKLIAHIIERTATNKGLLKYILKHSSLSQENKDIALVQSIKVGKGLCRNLDFWRAKKSLFCSVR